MTPVSKAKANEPMQLAETRYMALKRPSLRPIVWIGKLVGMYRVQEEESDSMRHDNAIYSSTSDYSALS